MTLMTQLSHLNENKLCKNVCHDREECTMPSDSVCGSANMLCQHLINLINPVFINILHNFEDADSTVEFRILSRGQMVQRFESSIFQHCWHSVNNM